MTNTIDLANWVPKLQIEVINEEDGSATIQIEWDETDPNLDHWTGLGKEGKEKFIINALYTSFENLELTNNDT
jgi:hypothetical protein